MSCIPNHFCSWDGKHPQFSYRLTLYSCTPPHLPTVPDPLLWHHSTVSMRKAMSSKPRWDDSIFFFIISDQFLLLCLIHK